MHNINSCFIHTYIKIQHIAITSIFTSVIVEIFISNNTTGFNRVRLLKVNMNIITGEETEETEDDREDTDEEDVSPSDFEVRHGQIELPNDDTTYWCSVHKLPDQFRQKHHVLQACISDHLFKHVFHLFHKISKQIFPKSCRLHSPISLYRFLV